MYYTSYYESDSDVMSDFKFNILVILTVLLLLLQRLYIEWVKIIMAQSGFLYKKYYYL